MRSSQMVCELHILHVQRAIRATVSYIRPRKSKTGVIFTKVRPSADDRYHRQSLSSKSKILSGKYTYLHQLEM